MTASVYSTPPAAPAAAPAPAPSVKTTITQPLPSHPATAATPAPTTAPIPATPPGAPANVGTAPAPTTAPAVPAPSLQANAAYNAFLNSLGLNDADLRNAATLKAGQIGTSEADNEGVAGRDLTNALARNELVYNGRGLVNSSDNLNARANLQSAGEDRIAAMRNASANSIANLYTNLAQQVAANQVKGAQQAQSAAGSQYVTDALNSSGLSAFTGA